MSSKKFYSPPTLSSEMLTVGVFGKKYNGDNGNHLGLINGKGKGKGKKGLLHWLSFK